MSLDEEEGGGGWIYGGEDHHEFAYEDYAFPHDKKSKREHRENTTQGDAGTADAAGTAVPPKDAFVGKHCPICLGAIAESSSVIESCNHIYCTACLFEWLQVSDRCPLCKTFVSRVLYDIKSPKDYKTHVHAPAGARNPEGSSSRSATARASLRGEQGQAAGGGSCSWASRGAEFRSVVYRRDLVAEPPEAKARRPKSLEQLRPWIAREVQAAVPGGGSVGCSGNETGGSERTRLVVDVVEALLKNNDVETQEGFCTIKEQGFLFENAGPFLHELWCFRWSKARMPAYDRDTVYRPRPSPRR
eukprot:g6119.t1